MKNTYTAAELMELALLQIEKLVGLERKGESK